MKKFAFTSAALIAAICLAPFSAYASRAIEAARAENSGDRPLTGKVPLCHDSEDY
ncbi:hypothetical protein [Methylobacterium soli]|uniref:hypothetical protein n=1 Tax=Methylobacterium soli TaxID=553447 RepID=UPI001782D831|nr:hypothetical protein [Methylobacterium soli]GJE46813.1 hypothetical protein AEGHOMDF_6022 [Methylobacterium soli]